MTNPTIGKLFSHPIIQDHIVIQATRVDTSAFTITEIVIFFQLVIILVIIVTLFVVGDIIRYAYEIHFMLQIHSSNDKNKH